MIQSCDLHTMLKLTQTLDLCIGLLKIGVGGTHGGGELHFYVSVLYSVVISAVLFYFCPFTCFTLI